MVSLGVEDALRRVFGSIDTYTAYHRALRTGELPTRVNPDVWRGGLNLRRTTTGLALFLSYCIALFVVVPWLTHQPPYHPAAASVLGLLAVGRIVYASRKRGWIHRLASKVETQAEAHPSSGEPAPEEEEPGQSWSPGSPGGA